MTLLPLLGVALWELMYSLCCYFLHYYFYNSIFNYVTLVKPQLKPCTIYTSHHVHHHSSVNFQCSYFINIVFSVITGTTKIDCTSGSCKDSWEMLESWVKLWWLLQWLLGGMKGCIVCCNLQQLLQRLLQRFVDSSDTGLWGKFHNGSCKDSLESLELGESCDGFCISSWEGRTTYCLMQLATTLVNAPAKVHQIIQTQNSELSFAMVPAKFLEKAWNLRNVVIAVAMAPGRVERTYDLLQCSNSLM